jgi:hypothetical protein
MQFYEVIDRCDKLLEVSIPGGLDLEIKKIKLFAQQFMDRLDLLEKSKEQAIEFSKGKESYIQWRERNGY